MPAEGPFFLPIWLKISDAKLNFYCCARPSPWHGTGLRKKVGRDERRFWPGGRDGDTHEKTSHSESNDANMKCSPSTTKAGV